MSGPPPPPDATNPYSSPAADGSAPPYAAASSDERLWAILCHLSGLAIFLNAPLVLAHIVAPLVIWLIQREKMPFVDDQGKEALNFQISMTIYMIVSAILVLVLVGIVLLFALLIFDVIVVIIAAVQANQGVAYRYPLCIRFIP